MSCIGLTKKIGNETDHSPQKIVYTLESTIAIRSVPVFRAIDISVKRVFLKRTLSSNLITGRYIGLILLLWDYILKPNHWSVHRINTIALRIRIIQSYEENKNQLIQL